MLNEGWVDGGWWIDNAYTYVFGSAHVLYLDGLEYLEGGVLRTS